MRFLFETRAPRRTLVLVATALVLSGALSESYAGETSGLPELLQVLAKVEGDPSVEGGKELQRSLEKLRTTDISRKQEFARASAQHLPQKAADRLAQVQAAYASGHGRLLAILEQLAEGPGARASGAWAGATSSPDRSALAHEAAEIVRRLQKSSGGRPISQSLSV